MVCLARLIPLLGGLVSIVHVNGLDDGGRQASRDKAASQQFMMEICQDLVPIAILADAEGSTLAVPDFQAAAMHFRTLRTELWRHGRRLTILTMNPAGPYSRMADCIHYLIGEANDNAEKPVASELLVCLDLLNGTSSKQVFSAKDALQTQGLLQAEASGSYSCDRAALSLTLYLLMAEQKRVSEEPEKAELIPSVLTRLLASATSAKMSLGWPIFFLFSILDFDVEASSELRAACPKPTDKKEAALQVAVREFAMDPSAEQIAGVLQAASEISQSALSSVCVGAKVCLLLCWAISEGLAVDAEGETIRSGNSEALLEQALLIANGAPCDESALGNGLPCLWTQLQAGHLAGWPVWRLLALVEWLSQEPEEVLEMHNEQSFCPAMTAMQWDLDNLRTRTYLEHMRRKGIAEWMPPAASSTTQGGAPSLAVVFILGCDSLAEASAMLIQVDALRTLRHSLLRNTQVHIQKFIVITSPSMPPMVQDLLSRCGFDLQLFPDVREGFLKEDRYLFEDLTARREQGMYPDGWYWGWLKLHVGRLVEVDWVLFMDSDMLVVGSLDPLLAALPPIGGNNEASHAWLDGVDIFAVMAQDFSGLNTGFMLHRTSLEQTRQMKAEVASIVGDLQKKRDSTGVHQQTFLQRLINKKGQVLGNATFDANGVLSGCQAAPASKLQGSSAFRWCQIPMEYNNVLPQFHNEGGEIVKNLLMNAEMPSETSLIPTVVADGPIRVLHFTGPFVQGRPWDKSTHQRSEWDWLWWNEHAMMCAEAAARQEPACSISCDMS